MFILRLVLLFLCFFVINFATLAGELENATKSKDIISEDLPYSLEFLRYRILTQFDSEDRAFYDDYNGLIYDLPHHAKSIADLSEKEYKEFIAFPIVRATKFYVFYGAYPSMKYHLQEITPENLVGVNNPALQEYAKLPEEDRSQDIYIWSPNAPYWYSEYSVNGVNVPFRSYFIFHLAAVDKGHTKLEIIEDKPTVNLGKKMNVDSHGVVHKYDIEDAPPTTKDREFMLSCVKQFIERKVPGRHWFNCRE